MFAELDIEDSCDNADVDHDDRIKNTDTESSGQSNTARSSADVGSDAAVENSLTEYNDDAASSFCDVDSGARSTMWSCEPSVECAGKSANAALNKTVSDCHNTVCDTNAVSVRASRKLSVKARKPRLDSENVPPVKRHQYADDVHTGLQFSGDANLPTLNSDNLQPITVKHLKRKWSSEELNSLFRAFGKDITQHAMPEGYRVKEFARKFPHRTVAQIRAQVHNYMNGKVKQV